MKTITFTVNKKDMMTAIKHVSKVAPTKSTFYCLESILVRVTENSVTVTGYDLEKSITESVSASASGTGSILIDPKFTEKILKHLPNGSIEFAVDGNNNINISAGKTSYEISGINSDDYPEILTPEEKTVINVSQSTLKMMLSETLYAASKDDHKLKLILTGALFDIKNGKLNICTLDGYRMAIKRANIGIESTVKNSFVVPAKILKEISTLLENDDNKMCRIISDEKNVCFEFSNIKITSCLLKGEFHRYENSISVTTSTNVVIDRDEMLKTLDQISLIYNAQNKSAVKMEFSDGEVTVSGRTSLGKFNKSFSADKNGNDITIGFNSDYILDAVKNIITDKIVIGMNRSNSAVKVMAYDDEENTIHIIMPMMLKN